MLEKDIMAMTVKKEHKRKRMQILKKDEDYRQLAWCKKDTKTNKNLAKNNFKNHRQIKNKVL